ncbi:MAG: FAD synthase [Candidatus Altiarchaeota archaeon]|nr:FAD synthase [Candidatus Altiarchaeota archaeon]
MRTVLATGVFDLLHPGHVLYLEEAGKLGDRLVVIVARDETAEKRKNRIIVPEKQRLAVVKALKPVDEAILGDAKDFYAPVQKIDPDVIVLGKDQHFNEVELEEELKKRGLKARVVRLESYWEAELDSSRKIVERIRKA